jgi:hypothetical protein
MKPRQIIWSSCGAQFIFTQFIDTQPTREVPESNPE